jgi:hypothetical protein
VIRFLNASEKTSVYKIKPSMAATEHQVEYCHHGAVKVKVFDPCWRWPTWRAKKTNLAAV